MKFDAQNSHGRFVPVVERTVKGPLKMTCGSDFDVETVVPSTTVFVAICSELMLDDARL